MDDQHNNKTTKTKSVSHPAPLLSTVNINNNDVIYKH